jgi:ABC-type branched-subunit amino acid transport system substrate-binding protein
MLYDQIAGRPSLISKLTTTTVSPGSKEFVQAFSNFTGTDASTNYQAYTAHAYDAVAALLRAYKAAAAPKDGPALKEQLNKTDFAGELLPQCWLALCVSMAPLAAQQSWP